MRGKAAKREREAFWKLVGPYLASDKEYEARFAAVILLSHYICDEWIDRTLAALYTVTQPDYYAQMAVAWAYSMCFVHYPEKTEEFLAENRLPDFTYKKTISKINDSLPVSEETKQRLRKYGFGLSKSVEKNIHNIPFQKKVCYNHKLKGGLSIYDD